MSQNAHSFPCHLTKIGLNTFDFFYKEFNLSQNFITFFGQR